MTIPHEDFHEIWWIYSAARDITAGGLEYEWAGLRIAHFRKTVNGTLIFFIQGEVDRRRIGVRIWDDVSQREGWHKVQQIEQPSPDAIRQAMDAK